MDGKSPPPTPFFCLCLSKRENMEMPVGCLRRQNLCGWKEMKLSLWGGVSR